MAGNLNSNRVLSGPYAGFTKDEVLTEWNRYKAELQKAGSRLTGATVNGQNFQFGPRGDMNLMTWGRQLRRALSQVDPSWIGPRSDVRIRFGEAPQTFGVDGNGF